MLCATGTPRGKLTTRRRHNVRGPSDCATPTLSKTSDQHQALKVAGSSSSMLSAGPVPPASTPSCDLLLPRDQQLQALGSEASAAAGVGERQVGVLAEALGCALLSLGGEIRGKQGCVASSRPSERPLQLVAPASPVCAPFLSACPARDGRGAVGGGLNDRQAAHQRSVAGGAGAEGEVARKAGAEGEVGSKASSEAGKQLRLAALPAPPTRLATPMTLRPLLPCPILPPLSTSSRHQSRAQAALGSSRIGGFQGGVQEHAKGAEGVGEATGSQHDVLTAERAGAVIGRECGESGGHLDHQSNHRTADGSGASLGHYGCVAPLAGKRMNLASRARCRADAGS